MAKTEKRGKKRNFTNCEVEILVGEVETRQNILFGGHSIGITNAKKATEWQHVADAVNSASAQVRTVAEIKKKWSDIKVEAKKRLASHRQSACATGGGKGAPELTPPMDEKLAGIIGESLLSGVVTEAEGDTDVQGAPDEPGNHIHIPVFEMRVNRVQLSWVCTCMYKQLGLCLQTWFVFQLPISCAQRLHCTMCVSTPPQQLYPPLKLNKTNVVC